MTWDRILSLLLFHVLTLAGVEGVPATFGTSDPANST